MGLIGNLVIAGLVRGRNRRVNHVSSRLFDFIPKKGNLIVCGGRTGEDGEAATRIKEDIFFECLSDSLKTSSNRRGPCIALCSPNSLSEETYEDIISLASDTSKDRLVYFGKNTSYLPFDNTVSKEQVINMFSRVIKKRYGENDSVSRDLEALMMKLIYFLHEGLDRSKFTFENLSVIVDHLVETDNSWKGHVQVKGLMEFLEWVDYNLGINTEGFSENFFINSWEVVVTKFYDFWNQYVAQINKTSVVNGKKRSLFSCLRKGEVCLMEVSPTYGDMLMETILNEIEFFTEESRMMCNLVSIHESAKGFEKYQLLDRTRSVLIGNTFGTFNLGECSIPDPTVVCLGVSARDAKSIFEMMVSTGNWVEMKLGFAPRGGHAGLSIVRKEPIATNELTLNRIRDGGGYVISSEGYTHVDHLLM